MRTLFLFVLSAAVLERAAQAEDVGSGMTNPPPRVIELAAGSSLYLAPFILTNEYLYQPIGTTLVGSGRAAFKFSILKDGDYAVAMAVEASNAAANSLYVNIDAEPQEPQMIWDIPVTTGFENRLVSWGEDGGGAPGVPHPKYFHLEAGLHELVVRGREAGVKLRTIYVVPRPSPVSNAVIKPASR